MLIEKSAGSMQGIVVTHITDFIGDSSHSSPETVKLKVASRGSPTGDWLSESQLSEFSSDDHYDDDVGVGICCERRNSSAFTRHVWYQTSHGRPHFFGHCPILMSLLLSQILGLTTVLKQHCQQPWIGTDTDSVTATMTISHIVSD